MARSLRVRFDTREAFARAWQDSLGRGAVFVHDDQPPPLQARVEVQLELAFAGAKATLEGEVIQHVPATAGTGAGVAVQLLAPLARLQKAFERFLGPAAEAPATAAPSAPPAREAAAPAPEAGSLFDDEEEASPGPEAPAEPLDLSDPFSFEVNARTLTPDDPEPSGDPGALPPPGVPFDPHERELD